MTKPKPKYPCPECGKVYDLPKVLGSHRLRAHGVAGTSKSSMRNRFHKALLPPEPDSYPCPDCDFVAASKAGLTIHRQAQHKIPSQSATAVAIRSSDPLRCPECGFQAAGVGALKLHRRKQHGIISISNREIKRRNGLAKKGLPIEPTQTITAVAVTHTSTSNGHHPEKAHVASDGIADAAIAFTAGRIEELLIRTATEYDVAPRTFTQRVIELVHAKTLWK